LRSRGKCGATIVTSAPHSDKPARNASMLATTPLTMGR
jgi:hypothetical protein